MVWVWTLQEEVQAGLVEEIDAMQMEGVEIPVTIGIKAPVLEHHLSVNMNMSAIKADVEELTDDLTVQSLRLN